MVNLTTLNAAVEAAKAGQTFDVVGKEHEYIMAPCDKQVHTAKLIRIMKEVNDLGAADKTPRVRLEVLDQAGYKIHLLPIYLNSKEETISTSEGSKTVETMDNALLIELVQQNIAALEAYTKFYEENPEASEKDHIVALKDIIMDHMRNTEIQFIQYCSKSYAFNNLTKKYDIEKRQIDPKTGLYTLPVYESKKIAFNRFAEILANDQFKGVEDPNCHLKTIEIQPAPKAK